VPETDSEIRAGWYRPEVWAAFVNPDPNRRRFLHRLSRELVHFIAQSSTAPNPELAARVARDPMFVEIPFASAGLQREWLREFLDTTPLIPEARKSVARHFLELPFDSSVNAAFAASLGPHGEAWKRFRAKKVDGLVNAWAERNRIEPDMLGETPRVSENHALVPSERQRSTQLGGLQEVHSTSGDADRAALLRVVETLDDTELRGILVPLSALERLLRSRT